MREELKPYPDYVAAEHPWLSCLPKGWNIDPLKRVSKVQTGIAKGRKYGEEETVRVPYLRVANVQDGYLDLSDVAEIDVLPSEARRFALKPSDVLMNEGGDADKLGRGHVWDGQIDPCLHQNHVFAIRCKKVLPAWVSMLSTVRYARAYFQTRAKQSTNLASISKTNLSEFPVVVPPINEQRDILAFLDRETAKIDRLMEVRRKQVERLQEQRAAVIHHAVTKGLDPNANMKPSGVEWLGEVPEHWEVKALKRETPVLRGASPRPIDDPIYFDDDGEYSWVRISDVTAAGMYLEETEQRLSTLGASLSVKMQPGSLFLSIAGSVGKPCVTRIKCCIHDGFVYFPRFKGATMFLFYVFASGEPYRGLGKLGTQLNLNTDTVASIVMGFPPLKEQLAIVAHVDRETAKLDTLAAKYRRELELLAEYRASLISHAVTGKIDVRGLVPPVTDESP